MKTQYHVPTGKTKLESPIVTATARQQLVTIVKRKLTGDELEDELDYISTLDDEDCEQYLRYGQFDG